MRVPLQLRAFFLRPFWLLSLYALTFFFGVPAAFADAGVRLFLEWALVSSVLLVFAWQVLAGRARAAGPASSALTLAENAVFVLVLFSALFALAVDALAVAHGFFPSV